MNVSSAPLSASYLITHDPATPGGKPAGGAAAQKSTIASLFEGPAASSSAKSSKGEGSAPGLDVAKKLKALGEQFLAVMLITDPVQRAKAASDLYKQFAEIGKEYAGATADGRAAASAASKALANGDAATTTDGAAAPVSDGPDATEGAVADEINGAPASAVPDPALAAAVTADAADQTPAGGAAPAAQPVVYAPGKASNFAADLYMEQIKTFANIAQQVYQAAVAEARHKHRNENDLHGLDDKMKDAKQTLTDAAKAVEGPAATADGYDPTAMATSSTSAPSPAVLNLTA